MNDIDLIMMSCLWIRPGTVDYDSSNPIKPQIPKYREKTPRTEEKPSLPLIYTNLHRPNINITPQPIPEYLSRLLKHHLYVRRLLHANFKNETLPTILIIRLLSINRRLGILHFRKRNSIPENQRVTLLLKRDNHVPREIIRVKALRRFLVRLRGVQLLQLFL